jgi:hypothetical protein
MVSEAETIKDGRQAPIRLDKQNNTRNPQSKFRHDRK